MQKKIDNTQIKIILGVSLTLTIGAILAAIIIDINYIHIFENEFEIVGSNYLVSFMAVITCFIYDYIYNREEFFILTLIYISFAIQGVCETILITNLQGVLRIDGLLIFMSIYRMILLGVIIKDNNRITRYLNKRNKLSVIITVVVTIMLISIEVYFKYMEAIIRNRDIIAIFNIGIIIYYIISIIKLSIRITKKGDFIWAIIIASMNMFIVKKVYLVVYMYNINTNLYELCKIFSFIGFFILIIGLFIEILSKVKENETLKEELEVFYNLTEQDPINNVSMYDEKAEILYANKLMRDNKYIDDTYLINSNKYFKLNKIYNPYKNINVLNNIDIKIRDYINEKVNKDGYFNEVVFLKDGTIIRLDIRQVEFKKSKLRNVVSFRDITEDYKNNREMKINENKLKSITENIKDIIGTIDLNGKITYVNSMVEKIVGYSSEELIGKNYTMLLDKREEKTYNFIKNNYKESAFMKHNVICKDGSIIIMESVVSRICTENNEVVGHAIVARDISYSEKFESLELKYNEMKAYDKIRGEFFANISHELRTPINIICSCFQLLNNKKENGVKELAIYYNKYENTIKQNCFRLLRLVNNLIDITKIDSGYIKMRFGNYNIINLVEEVTLSVVPYVEAKKINIMFDTEVEELEIKCDPDDIERVMLNLIANAIKFNKVGGNILVNISVSEDWVEISVKDTGIGVSEELKSCIFERFAQHDKSFNRENEGSGIGLALVKALVELHDGEVYLNDNEDEGSEFIVKLPNVTCENIDEDVKNISGNNTKPTSEKIYLELSDIYDLL